MDIEFTVDLIPGKSPGAEGRPLAISRRSDYTSPMKVRPGMNKPPLKSWNQPIRTAGIPPGRPVVQRRPMAIGVVQRYCGTPGCNDPHCHNEANHGFERVYNLRNRTVYHGNINQQDIGSGTGTNQTVRDHVNSPTTNYPQQVSIAYSGGNQSGWSEFINQPLAPNQRAQAGHIFGKQYGGYGDQTAAVFPQHPQTNMGHSHNGVSTRPVWRQHEDNVRQIAEGGNTVHNTVTLRPTERGYYDRACRQCYFPNNRSAANCAKCGHVL